MKWFMLWTATDESLEKLWVDAEFVALGKCNSDEILPESNLSSPTQWQFCSQQQWQQLQTEPVGKDVKGGRGQGHESH